MFRRALSVAVAATVFSVAATGCGQSSIAPTAAPSNLPETGLELFLSEAQAGNANQDQLAILERAVGVGVVTLEDVSQAVDATIGCLEEAGLRVTRSNETLPTGLVLPTYSYGAGEGQDDAIAQSLARQCMEENSAYVEKAYQLQPSSRALYDAKFTAARPQIIECLSENGVVVDPDATNDEIATLANELAFGMTDEELLRAAQESDGGVVVIDGDGGPDCLIFLNQ